MNDISMALQFLALASEFFIDPEWVKYVNAKFSLGLIEMIRPPKIVGCSFRGDGVAFIRAFVNRQRDFRPLATSTPLPPGTDHFCSLNDRSPSPIYGECETINEQQTGFYGYAY
ncbi:Hypothetical protein NTJ_01035 [Nesidiocoris tenuis]|uniref:Uncharacterized protein n=1 Tax=Nesidiocoris tenuis TaxID=355587 RepID=A0ABN7AAQ4_9HEMI|nr:Hypothetical protein NTJ_01035 [Nesidiocoris tenuis]